LTADLLVAYKKHKGHWSIYESTFLGLMRKREIEKRIDPETIKGVQCPKRPDLR
jgi:hypothetical protein